MHVVIVSEGACYPPTAGNRIRTLNLMLQLAPRHRMTYVCRSPADPGEARQVQTFLGDHGIETLLVEDPVPVKTGLGFYGSLALNLFSPLPYAVGAHNSRALRRALDDYAARNPVDVWQFEWIAYADALRHRPGARTIAVAHNVESLIWQRYYETERNPLKRWYVMAQWRKFERFERRIFRGATRVVAVSPEDAALFRLRFGVQHVDVVDNGIDRAAFEAVRPERDPKQVLFLGSLEWRPNQDGVRLLLERVFPEVRAREPAARLAIVGRNPPDWLVRQAAALPGVEVHANVPDVRPFLARCGVFAVPLRIGGGSRLKILEALACAAPVVSTKVGAEGLCLEPGRHYVAVEQIEDMAAAIVECMLDPAAAREAAERGRGLVLERYDWGTLAEKLERVWEKCLVSAAAGPVERIHS
jgi:glycosyltransferase involved in cell wall biosynthesis